MGASAFIFLALYCLNKDPHCFLFSKPHPHRNLINYSTERRKIQQGNRIHLPDEKREEGENATAALRDADIQHQVLMHNPVLHLTVSGAAASISSC